MASDAHVILVAPAPGALAVAERRLRCLESRWSRFLPDSDISRLNTMPDTWIPVSPDTGRLIHTMQRAVHETGGSYDPTFLYELLDAGYDRSIEDPSTSAVMVDLPCPDHTVFDARTDDAGRRAFAPTGLALDPGGIGKGLAADLVVTELLESGTGGALVSIGGDLAAAGAAPTREGWIVAVEDPHVPGSATTTVAISGGGAATSSTRSRRWERDGAARHHVIDPATGTCAATDLVAATVFAGAGWLAEAHATAALVRGSRGAGEYLESRDLAGIIVDDTGATATTGDLREMARTSGR